MEISINVSGLKRDLSRLQEELSEINALLQLLDSWELAESDKSSHFFSNQYNELQKQRDMICQRISIIEVLIEEFTKCIYTMDRALQHSNNFLHSLN